MLRFDVHHELHSSDERSLNGAHLLGRDALLQPVVTRHQELLDPASGVRVSHGTECILDSAC
jgi:hypothetical protein